MSEFTPGWLGYIGDYTTKIYRVYYILFHFGPFSGSMFTQLCGDYFMNHYKDPRIPIKQPEFNGMSLVGEMITAQISE